MGTNHIGDNSRTGAGVVKHWDGDRAVLQLPCSSLGSSGKQRPPWHWLLHCGMWWSFTDMRIWSTCECLSRDTIHSIHWWARVGRREGARRGGQVSPLWWATGFRGLGFHVVSWPRHWSMVEGSSRTVISQLGSLLLREGPEHSIASVFGPPVNTCLRLDDEWRWHWIEVQWGEGSLLIFLSLILNS